MARNQFYDPRTDQAYDWIINHSEEEQFGRERNVEHTAPTGRLGLVRHQGEASPLTIQLRGTILNASQHDEMVRWFGLCQTQTIEFWDFADNGYEVLITSFQPIRQRTLRNMRDPDNAPLWYWTYTLNMEVVTVIAGAWEDVPL